MRAARLEARNTQHSLWDAVVEGPLLAARSKQIHLQQLHLCRACGCSQVLNRQRTVVESYSTANPTISALLPTENFLRHRNYCPMACAFRDLQSVFEIPGLFVLLRWCAGLGHTVVLSFNSHCGAIESHTYNKQDQWVPIFPSVTLTPSQNMIKLVVSMLIRQTLPCGGHGSAMEIQWKSSILAPGYQF